MNMSNDIMTVASNDKDQDLPFTRSADEILDVTPVHSRSPSSPNHLPFSGHYKFNKEVEKYQFNDEEWETGRIKTREQQLCFEPLGLQSHPKTCDDRDNAIVQQLATKSNQSLEATESFSSATNENITSEVGQSKMTSSPDVTETASSTAFPMDGTRPLHNLPGWNNEDSGKWRNSVEEYDWNRDAMSRLARNFSEGVGSHAESTELSVSRTKIDSSTFHDDKPISGKVSKISVIDRTLTMPVISSINLSNSSDGVDVIQYHDHQKYQRNDDDNSSFGSASFSEGSATSSMSEWDKALQIGKSFSGRADAKTFTLNNLKTRSGIYQHRLGPFSLPKLHAVPEESDLDQTTIISSTLTTGNLNQEDQTVNKPEAVLAATTEASEPIPEEATKQASKAVPSFEPQNHIQNVLPAVLGTNSSHSSHSDYIPFASTMHNPALATHPYSPSCSGTTNSHYPPILQHPSRQSDQRRTSGSSVASTSSGVSSGLVPRSGVGGGGSVVSAYSNNSNDHLSAGVLPDVLMTVRQKIESMALFDSDIMRLVSADYGQSPGSRNQIGSRVNDDDPAMQESRELLKRSSQQSISAAVLVSLAHKRYERRRLAAMEIEKVVRSLVTQHQQYQELSAGAMNRIRAILLLLSDDYVRSTSEDARKGGVVALAACAIGLKKADESIPAVQECRDIILASVVHACQDHSQRVRYYATESLFNVVKVIPALAINHFFILFEILRSLYADVDVDVRSGAELLDKKLKEIIVGAMNAGIFTADACVPVFSRFVFMKHKVTKRLTLTWLQELNEKLIGSSHTILEFLHLFLTGIFNMVADPSIAIRQSALAFLQSVLPKLLVANYGSQSHYDNVTSMNVTPGHGGNTASMFDSLEDIEMNVVDFDKILQSLVTTMEHPNPFVRKVAMYWICRIVRAHVSDNNKNVERRGFQESTLTVTPNRSDSKKTSQTNRHPFYQGNSNTRNLSIIGDSTISPASQSVRNSVPHVLPGILLCIGDSFQNNSNASSGVNSAPKDTFLPDQTTRDLAEQANACLQEAVRNDGAAFVQHLDGFIVALREELDSRGFHAIKSSPASYRTPYRMDLPGDGTGIETAGWFRSSREEFSNNMSTTEAERSADDGLVQSRLCALHWIIVLYENVVPDPLKADFAKVFILAIIHQLADNPPQTIVRKSLEVLAKITVPEPGEMKHRIIGSHPMNTVYCSPAWNFSTISKTNTEYYEDHSDSPISDDNINFAMNFLDESSRRLISRDREVFSSLIQLFSFNEHLVADLSNVLTYMCKLQPPAFVMVSFGVELERFIKRRRQAASGVTCNVRVQGVCTANSNTTSENLEVRLAMDLRFVSTFIQHMNHVLFNKDEAKELRDSLKDCVGQTASRKSESATKDRRRLRIFTILLHSFAHNLAATLSLCLWSGAYRTAYLFLTDINPLDINLMFFLEIDRLIEMLERPLFRYIQVRMLERDLNAEDEGSAAMLFQFLKCVLMLLPQSTCYRILRDRLASLARFRQSSHFIPPDLRVHAIANRHNPDTDAYVARICEVRELHCEATWNSIRQGSLEVHNDDGKHHDDSFEAGSDRRLWLGYDSKEAEQAAAKLFIKEKKGDSYNECKIDELKHDFSQSMDISSEVKRADVYLHETSNDDEKVDDDYNMNRWINFWTGSNN